MKTAYIHIGLEKTGTTAIQHSIKINKDYLEGKGLIIAEDKSGGEDTMRTHHRIAKSFINDTKFLPAFPAYSTSELDKLFRSSKNPKGDILVSSELFCYYDQSEISKLKKYLSKYEVKIIVFFRRQDQFFESQYNQHIKGIWGLGKLPIDIKKFEAKNIKYVEFLEQWLKAFGKEKVQVNVYGGYKTNKELFTQFYKNISSNFNLEGFEVPNALPNPSLSFVHTFLIMNYVGNVKNEELRKKVAGLIFRHNGFYTLISPVEFKNKGLLPVEDRQAMLQSFQEDNKKLLEMFPSKAFSKTSFFSLPSATELKSYNYHIDPKNAEIIKVMFNMLLYQLNQKESSGKESIFDQVHG